MHPITRSPITRRRLVGVATLAAVTIAVTSGPALGWGRVGHRVSARLAETLLTPNTRAAIRDLLLPGESLADASTWPDEVRRDRPESAPWHYVNVPITEPGYDPKYCPPGGCVVSKIPDFLATLRDADAPLVKRREALRFVVHFVQDMHQPLHVGDRRDRGGNDLQVQFFGEGSNLHRVWDSGLIDHVVKDEAKTFDRLQTAFTAGFVGANSAGTVVDWANESHAAAKDAFSDPSTGQPLQKGAKLADAYQARQIAVAERRVMQSAVRLARLLNEALDPSYRAPKP